ncbi:hypothetical protein ACP0I1_22340 [Pseudomonas aeruginosa]
MSNELTDVRCPCGAEFQADSYDAGFIAGSGMCQNCDAALPPKDICTCPSGNGSLRHPCPAHPAPVEQVGTNVGHGHVFPRADGVKMRCGGPGLCSECAADASRARAALAQPSPTLPPFAEKVLAKLRRFYDCAEDFESGGVDIGRHWLDLLTQLGLLNRVQRSPALWEISQQGEDLLGTPHPSPAQAEKAEAERPEVVAWRYGFSGGIVSDKACLDEWKSGGEYQSLMTVAQHERIVGELRAVIAQLRQHKNDYMDSGQETYRALQNEIREREAEIARLDGLVSGRTAERDAALAEVNRLRESKGDPSGSFDRCMRMMYERDENAKRLDAALARVAELERGKVYVEARQCDECQHGGINDSATGVAACHECDWTGPEPEEDRCPGCQRENCMAAACPQCGARYVLVASEEIAAPVAQAQQLNDLDKQCRDDVARALGLRPNQERGFAWSYLLASIKSCVKASGDSAQAQHSAPDVCDGKEQDAFEEWARKEGLDTSCHPMHWLFLDAKTNSARQGWKAALRYVRAHIAAPSQAQHSVPEGWMLVPVEPLLNMMSDKDHDTRITAERQLLSILAAAPGKEGV